MNTIQDILCRPIHRSMLDFTYYIKELFQQYGKCGIYVYFIALTILGIQKKVFYSHFNLFKNVKFYIHSKI